MKLSFLDGLLGKKTEYEAGAEPQAMNLLDFIAPPAITIGSDYFQIGEKFAKSYFIFSYPRYLSTGWLAPIINLDIPLDISIFFHPIDTGLILKKLSKKVTEVQSEIMEKEEKGLIRDPILETAYKDIEVLRDRLQTAQERMFRVGMYLTIYADDKKELEKIEGTVRSILESKLVYVKPALYQQDKAMISAYPAGIDRLQVHTSINTSPLSTIFPFVSFDLSSNEGILYGINQHNSSLVLFDRFSLENANSVVFGKSGGGKSILSSEPVLISENGQTKIENIGKVVERAIEKHGCHKIDEELEGAINPYIKVWSFDKNLKGSWSTVTVAARKKAPEIFYKFRTRSGREVSTTGDHNMLILKNGQITAEKSSEINEGEFIPLSRRISENSSPDKFINLLELLKNSHLVYVFNAEKIIKKYYHQIKNLDSGSSLKKYLYKYKDGRRIPIKYFLEIIDSLKISEAELNDLKIVSKNGDIANGLNIILPISNNLLKIIGFIASEGTVGENFINISNQDEEFIKECMDSFKNIGVPCYQADKAIICASRIFTEIIKALGGKQKSGDKTVLPFIFNAEKEKIAQFLSAYFEGDGGVEHDKICATTKSKQLSSEISYLLYYFGIIARIQKKIKCATNTEEKRKQTYWQISVSGKNDLEKFAQEIGFISHRKINKLNSIIKENGNTNVDIIPGLAPLFEEIYNTCPPLLMGMQTVSALKRGIYNPSPDNLKNIIEKIEKRITYFKDRGEQIKVLSGLPEIQELIEYGENIDKETEDNLDYNYSPQVIMTEQAKQTDRLIWQEYQEILRNGIPKIENIIKRLKNLANSDLFFDEIVNIEKIANKDEQYVYDLTVDNEVFLCGNGGMFVHNSYAIKLEILRSLMLGIESIIIDPENEYRFLSDAVGGKFYNISLASESHINPFDLPEPVDDEEPKDVLRSNIINLVGLMRIMLGGLTPEEDSVIDQAINETYAARDITADTDPGLWKERVPLMSDLESVLETMEGAESLVKRLRKFTKGVYAGFFNYPTNVVMDNALVVFGIKNLETELRPLAMFIVMRYIWNAIKGDLKKRILVIDEAWWLMQTEDSASFLYGIVKRGRKYWLGTTTITQDVNDFMKSDYGQPIITNSSLQLLMKQSPATIQVVKETFNLTDQEKYLLLEAPIGEGIFFAGEKHVSIRIVASYTEDQIITTSPEEMSKIKKLKKIKENA
ncbi:hypothetical protein KJ562_00420 [Patescibacteria group bacterium]|nr:hypothetical protein [Patescibacteria group bacterium]MBU4162056.1 hypothetical protein [Patescibacteria group bacterium]